MSSLPPIDTNALLKRVEAAVDEGHLSKDAALNLRRWITGAAYAEYLPQIETHLVEGKFEELESAFWTVIPFGTGGRRGTMCAIGTAVINDRTIGESAQGLADYLRKTKGTGPLRAVISRDGRNRSDDFARLTASVLAANGFEVFYFPEPRATPELSFAVRHLGCAAGVMISASHNPPSDNGVKCYWDTGGQVLALHEEGVIECVYAVDEIRRVPFDEAVAAGQVKLLDDSVDRAYCEAVCGQSVGESRDIRILFTPLHGVGESAVCRVLQRAGFKDVDVLASQRAIDGNFTNVPNQVPNPEVPAALGPAIETARSEGHNLVLASDPDADRLGAAVRVEGDGFVPLTGNQIASLIADFVLSKKKQRGELTSRHYLVKTLVTTDLLRRIAGHYGVEMHGNLLVGFKYIAQEIDSSGPERFVFGAEESYGYLTGSYARDKDAAVAALLLAELAAELKAQGKTLVDQLDALYLIHGYHVEGAASKTCPGAEGVEQSSFLLERFRTQPPVELGGVRFGQVNDYDRHEVRSLPSNEKTEELPDPKGPLLFFHASEEGFAFAVRPSGTEPKIKFYLFGYGLPPSDEQLAEVKKTTDARLEGLRQALLEYVDETLAGF